MSSVNILLHISLRSSTSSPRWLDRRKVRVQVFRNSLSVSCFPESSYLACTYTRCYPPFQFLIASLFAFPWYKIIIFIWTSFSGFSDPVIFLGTFPPKYFKFHSLRPTQKHVVCICFQFSIHDHFTAAPNEAPLWTSSLLRCWRIPFIFMSIGSLFLNPYTLNKTYILSSRKPTSTSYLQIPIKVTGTNYGGRSMDACIYLLSRGLVSFSHLLG